MVQKQHQNVDKPMRRATDHLGTDDTPKTGDRYHCDECGMELQITADCGCANPEMVQLQCCGQNLIRD